MKKILASALAATLLLGLLAGCGKPAPAVSPTAAPQVFNGTGDGYGGVITAVVTKTGDKISVKLTGEHETAGIGADALPKLETAINEKGGIEGVDAISGATWTSKGAFYAVQNALDPAANPYPIAEDTGNTENATAAAAFQGLGFSNSGRVGPGKDDTDTPVYSLNQVLANAIFDGEGRILSLYVDQIEVATPNYDGEGMPHFAGFPGQEYNYDENHDEKVDGKLAYSDESFLAEVASWQTKRQRGEGYKLSSSTWDKEMDKFQSLFVGMTAD
ncbi:MAG: FMN-binding protein, partial [Pseudoflavonifractor sp.]